jgi:hypothetical protein
MKLYFTPTSPFVRKVMVCAHERGLAEQVETVLLRPSPLKADAALSRENPLSKIPVLVTGDGESIYDSSVICEYLDSIGDAAPLTPARGPARFRTLRLQALADGILEAGVFMFYERTLRPKELQWEAGIDGQAEKARQGLDALEREAPAFSGVDLGQVCVAVTLGWLEFRAPLGDLRQGRPNLFAWYDAFSQRPSMQATAPKVT